MKNRSDLFPRFSPVGESALLLELDDSISIEINRQVHALDDWLSQSPLRGVHTRIPGYASLLVCYDPLEVTHSAVRIWLEKRIASCPAGESDQPKQVEIPVWYGGEEGPDLAHVAEFHGLSPAEVVAKHTSQTYRVGMMGFTPGFAYLMGLDPSLATPRLTTPRTSVPAGSVGIAGEQTGIYPLDSPGGWQLIGRTNQVLFDPQKPPHFLFSPGDEVRFVAQNGSEGI